MAIDLLYYGLHRAEHSNRTLWAIHSVHHQSTICDTSVSLRTSMLTPITVFGSHLVLAALGLPLWLYIPAYAAHVAVVFLLHTRTPALMNRAGWVLNRPWLHRGHHSNHPALRGKNLGGVLIVWDRLFGTFEGNCEQATAFGIGKLETPLSPVRANWMPLRALLTRG
jgi:sterol desaturase/sphingolipid hydroxylase (fatty acid hydroxylase superfamily)